MSRGRGFYVAEGVCGGLERDEQVLRFVARGSSGFFLSFGFC